MYKMQLHLAHRLEKMPNFYVEYQKSLLKLVQLELKKIKHFLKDTVRHKKK